MCIRDSQNGCPGASKSELSLVELSGVKLSEVEVRKREAEGVQHSEDAFRSKAGGGEGETQERPTSATRAA